MSAVLSGALRSLLLNTDESQLLLVVVCGLAEFECALFDTSTLGEAKSPIEVEGFCSSKVSSSSFSCLTRRVPARFSVLALSSDAPSSFSGSCRHSSSFLLLSWFEEHCCCCLLAEFEAAFAL